MIHNKINEYIKKNNLKINQLNISKVQFELSNLRNVLSERTPFAQTA